MATEKLLLNVQLVSAIENRDYLKVNKLLEEGADANFINFHYKNETPLHYAVTSGSLENVQLLLARGASPEAKNVDNKKPIELCAFLDDQKKRAIGAMLSEFSKKSKPIKSDQQTTKTDFAGKTFTKRAGTAAAGQFYETKLLTMVLFRLLHDDQVESFLLGTNINEAGAFDDIVLRTSVGGKTYVHCLQAKHRDSAASVNFKDLVNMKDTKGDFHLSKYFDSFLQLRYMFSQNSNHAIFQEEYDKTDLEMIIFTPASINYPDDVLCENTKNSNIFFTKEKGKTCQIECTEELLNSFTIISQEWHKKAIAEILTRLILSKRYGSSNLKASIEKLQNDNVLSEFSDQNVSFNCAGLLQLYDNQKLMTTTYRNIKQITVEMVSILEGNLLPTDDDHSKIVNEFFAKLRFYSEQATEDELDDIVRHDIKKENYESDDLVYSKSYAAVESWWKRSGQVPFLNNNCSIFEAAVNEVKLDTFHAIGLNTIRFDALKFSRVEFVIREWFNLCKNVEKDKHFCMNIYSTTPELSCVKIIQYLQYYKCNFKFIILDQAAVLNILEDFAMNNSQCTIVAFLPELTLQTIDHVLLKLNKLVIITKEKFNCQGKSVNVETTSLLELEIKCREKLLETSVTFQGYSIPLKLLFSEASPSMIDAATVQKLAHGEHIVISNAGYTNDHDDIIKYIDRVLIKNSDNKQIYKSITEVGENIVVVASEPGMGKSTLLTGLATFMKNSNPSSWIVRLNLLDYSKQLHEWNDINLKINKSHAMHLLVVASCNQTKVESIETKLFHWCCENDKIILLVDGFDEVSPDYTSIVLQLLEIYKDCLTRKLWVTTRTGGVQKDLESRLGVQAYSLKPFSMDETKLFLWNMWKTKLEIKSDQKHVFENYVQKLLSHLSTSIEHGESELVSVPLQMKMIAMIFQDNFKQYCSATSSQLKFEKIDLVSLYENFIELQFKVILVEQKNKTDLTKPFHKKHINISFKEFEIKHKQAAIYAIFNPRNIENIIDKSEVDSVIDFLQEVQDSTEMTGIITRVIDGKPIFVHQTYAEFFAAQFICEKYCSLQEREFESFLEDIVINFLVRNEQVQIVIFLLGMIQKKVKSGVTMKLKSSLLLSNLLDILPTTWKEFNSRVYSLLLGIVECSLSVHSEHFEEIKTLVNVKLDKNRIMLLLKASEAGYLWLVRVVLDESIDEINANVDWLDNWTALHFATNGGFKVLVEYLAGKSANINSLTKEDGRSPLHMAAEKGYCNIVQVLIDKCADVNCTITNTGITPLHLAAREGFIDIVAVLLEKKVEIDSSTTVDGETALHIASGNNHLGVVQLLIEHSADVNIRTKKNGSTPLHVATMNGHLAIVEALMEKTSHIDIGTTEFGYTPLHWAVRRNMLAIATVLLDRGAHIDNVSEVVGHAPLHIATIFRHTEIFKLLLEKGAMVNIATKCEHLTPLHLAARDNFCEIATMLLDRGADIDSAGTEDGETPLHSAVERKNLEMVQLLINRGANVNIATTGNEWTALHLAARNDCPQMIKLLVDSGANLNCITSDNGDTPLLIAFHNEAKDAIKMLFELGANVHIGTIANAFTPLHCAAWKDYTEIIEILMEKKANINCVTLDYGVTPLLEAIQNGSTKAVRILLQHGADVHLGMTNNAYMPIHIAAECNNVEIIRLLLDNGANIDCITSDYGATPLYVACHFGATNAVQALLENGAKVHIGTTTNSFTPLHVSARNNHPEIIQMLLDNGSDLNCTTSDSGETPLYVASSSGATNAVITLLQLGANVNLGTVLNASAPLHVAACLDHSEIINLLVKNGANIDCRTSDFGATPLYTASHYGSSNATKMLLQCGANVQLGLTNNAYTPLHIAAFNDHPQIIEILLSNGSSINCTTSDDGRTSLYEACRRGSVSAVKMLLDFGADPNVGNTNDGFTPLHTAVWNNHHKIINLLVKKGANMNCTSFGDGQTPLDVACEKRAIKAIDSLLELGAE